MRYIEAFVLCARIACLYAKNSEYECFVSDAKTSEENPLRHIFPTTLDEFKVFEYNGVLCNECNDTYDGPCPLHVLKYVASRPKPSTYLHHRAEKTAPKNILRLEESCIPDAGAGIWTIKRIPKNVVFGPLDGDIVERKNNKTIDIGNYWKIPGTEKSYIDLLDKSKANYMAYINCARNVKEENLIKYFNETDQKFYFKSKTPISKYSELLVDYGTEFRKLIGISDLDFSRPRELKREIFVCDKCLKASYTPVGLMPHHYCPVPSKKDDLWLPVLNNKTIVQRQIVRHEKENPNAFKSVFECKACDVSAKNKSKQMSEKDIKMHFLRRHSNITEFDPKTVIRDDFVMLNKLCNRFYKCNICANESAGLNWTMTPLRRPESIEFDKFVAEFERAEKKLKDNAKEDDVVKLEDVIMQFNEEKTVPPRLELTSLSPGGTRKRLKINRKFFFKLRDDAQCHFKTKHMPLCNITDVRVMKYRGEPHECELCGNETSRKLLGIDHHVDYHLNFTEMFDRGLIQLDYRTKKLNEPYIENFNFSHLYCTKCNQYIDTDKNHEPEPEEILQHKLSHVNLNVLSYSGHVQKKKVQIGDRPVKLYHNVSYVSCLLCSNFTSTNKSSFIQHMNLQHTLRPHHLRQLPLFLRPALSCHKCGELFHSQAELIDHVTKVHREYYYCVCCGKTNYYRRLHQRHMVKMHNNSTATVLYDDWAKVDKLWTSISEPSGDSEPTLGNSVFTVDSSEYNEQTEPHINLNSLGN